MSRRLLESKISEVTKEFKTSFETWAVTRKILNVITYEEAQTYFTPDIDSRFEADDFIRIGLSHIIERFWFTENSGSVFYDHKNMGDNYGKSIAFGETKYVLNELKNKNKNHHLINAEELQKVMNEIIKQYPQQRNLSIISNPVSITKLIGYDNYRMVMKPPMWGFYMDTNIPLYYSPEIQMGEFYLFDKLAGTIVIKEDANISVTEINQKEFATIWNDIPALVDKNLFDYVRVRPREIIKFVDNEHININSIKVIDLEEIE